MSGIFLKKRIKERSSHSRLMRVFCIVVCTGVILTSFTGCGKSVASPELIAVSASGSEITVTWSTVEGAEQYRLYKKTSSDPEYKFVCDSEECTYTDDHVLPGAAYSYKVRAIQGGTLSEGVESEEITVLNAPEITAIKMLSQQEITVKWKDLSAESYLLYAATDKGDWILAAETADCEYLLQDAQDYTKVCISAVVSSDDGRQIETAKSEAETLLRGCTITSVTRLDQSTAAILFENDMDTQNYLVFRASSPDGEYTNIGQSFENAFYDTGLQNGSIFYYRVQPITAKIEGPMSEPVAIGKNARPVSGIPVFMYHEFVTQEDLDSGIVFDEYAVWKDEFEQDLIWLRDNGYTTITTAQLTAWLNGTGTMPEKPVMLTIDDGKYGVYKNAWPLLEEYDMTAVLAVIGEEIDAANENPEKRRENPAPFCTWEEIGEMSHSGAVEIVSHSYTKHHYMDNGHKGADIAVNETEDTFLLTAREDYQRMDAKLNEITNSGAVAFAYPYSIRSFASDRVWRCCGYSVLLAGNSDEVRSSYYNLYIEDAGINYYSAVTRRIPRMTGTPISQYIAHALAHDGR